MTDVVRSSICNFKIAFLSVRFTSYVENLYIRFKLIKYFICDLWHHQVNSEMMVLLTLILSMRNIKFLKDRIN